MMAQENGDSLAFVEAPREIIQYINRGEKLMKLFDEVGYCLYMGVVLCELGSKDKIIAKIAESNTLSPYEIMMKGRA